MTVVENIINNLKTGLLDINTNNGYDNSISEVQDKILKSTDISNFPTICIGTGNDRDVLDDETGSSTIREIDILIFVHLGDNSFSVIESHVGDVLKYFQLSDLVLANKVCSLHSIDYVQSFKVDSIDRLSVVINNYGSFGILLKVRFTDVITNIDEPSVPSLNLPLNGSTNESVYTQFDWSSTGSGSIEYQIQIGTNSDFGNVVLDVDEIEHGSYTVPYDSPLTNSTTYYWRVRATNLGGTSNWSSTRSFTPNETIITPYTPIQITSCSLWLRSDSGITLSGSTVTTWNDQSGNSNNFTQGTGTNRPVLVSNYINGLPALYFDPTSSFKNLSKTDAAGTFKINGSTTKSFMLTYVPEARTNTQHNTLLSRGNNSLGEQYGITVNPQSTIVPNFYCYPGVQTIGSGHYWDLAISLNYTVFTNIILVCNGMTTTVYRDGLNIGTFVVTAKETFVGSIPDNSSTSIIIGTGRPNGTQGAYKGYVLEVAYWNRLLTQSEARSLYKYQQNFYGV